METIKNFGPAYRIPLLLYIQYRVPYVADYKRKTAMTSRKVYGRKHSHKFKEKVSYFC